MIRENSLLLELARAARDAARDGQCRPTRENGPKVRALDPVFYDQVFALDPMIATCLDPQGNPRYEVVLRASQADPPATGGRILGEIFLGMITGAGGAIAGALIGGGLCIGGSEDDCDASQIGGAYLGSILTIPFGVRAAGATGDQTGSLRATYIGAALGGVGGLLLLANGRDRITGIGFAVAPTIGALIAFNATRRYKPRRVRARVQVTGSLVDWGRGGPALGVPIVTHARTDGRAVTSIPLLGGAF
jgi:hypothetical protein